MDNPDKNQWYYEDHGKACGPLSTREIIRRVQDGELNLVDLVFKEGDGQWLPIESFIEITSLLKVDSAEYKQAADWIVLRTVEVDGQNKYEQIGPYQLDQVLQLIDKGRIKFTDHVWRTGYANWVPLGKIDSFEKDLPSSLRVDLSIYDKPKSPSLGLTHVAPVKDYKPIEKIKPVLDTEKKPLEAKGEDLARPKWILGKEKIKEKIDFSSVKEVKKDTKVESKPLPAEAKIKKNAKQVIEETLKKAEEVIEEITQKRELVKSRWSFVASLLVVVALLGGGSLFLLNGQKAWKTLQSQSENEEIVVPAPRTEETVVTAGAQESLREELQPEMTNGEGVETEASVSQVAQLPKPLPALSFQQEPKLKQSAKAKDKNQTKDATVKVPVRPMAPAPLPTTPVKEKVVEFNFAKMNSKEKSFFHQNERMFIFYNAQKGSRLIDDLQKMAQKKFKKPSEAKLAHAAWLTQLKVYVSGVQKMSGEQLIYADMNKQLLALTLDLDLKGRELIQQLKNTRGPSRELTLKDLQISFNKLATKAKNLD